MLGNRVILLGVDKNIADNDILDANAEMVAAANYHIPMFWLLLFEVASIKQFSSFNEPSDQGFDKEGLYKENLDNDGSDKNNPVPYPVLVCNTVKGIERLRMRIQLLETYLTGEEKGLAKQWVQALTQVKFPYLAIDTYELCNQLGSVDACYTQLNEELESLEQLATRPQQCLDTFIKNNRWERNNSISLGGFGW